MIHPAVQIPANRYITTYIAFDTLGQLGGGART
jgi:hypothetical protein